MVIKGYFLDKCQKSIEKKHMKKPGNKVIYMFHEVSEDRKQWYDERYSISFTSFEEFVETILHEGCKICFPEEVLGSSGDFVAALTFDDTFKGIYYLVFPYLRERNIPFTIFPTVNFIDKDKYLSSQMIQEMLKYDGCRLGAHSISHCLLTGANDSRCYYEIAEPKKLLEEKFGENIELFAYPYGAMKAAGKREIGFVKKAGYKYAFSTLQTYVIKSSDPFFIPRINMNEENWRLNLQILRTNTGGKS